MTNEEFDARLERCRESILNLVKECRKDRSEKNFYNLERMLELRRDIMKYRIFSKRYMFAKDSEPSFNSLQILNTLDMINQKQ